MISSEATEIRILPAAGGLASASFSLALSPFTSAGTFNVNVTGTSGILTHSTQATGELAQAQQKLTGFNPVDLLIPDVQAILATLK